MKPIEGAFASEALRRVILPGIVLAIGVHPLIGRLVSVPLESLYGVSPTVLFVTEIVFFGLILSSAVQWVYYVYEGFRLRALTGLAGRINRRRVQKLSETQKALMAIRDRSQADENRLSQVYEALLDFPIRQTESGSVEYFADRPTLLGNIIASYELYPDTRYGVDGVFYWFHLLSLAPENGRREFSDKYIFAESLVLTSFSGVLVAMLHAFALIGFGIGILCDRLTFIVLPVGPGISLILFVLGVVVSVLFYAAALPAHREAGRVFQVLVDMAMPSLVKRVEKFDAAFGEDARKRLELVKKYLSEPSNANLPSASEKITPKES
jgi:hypothetical protein